MITKDQTMKLILALLFFVLVMAALGLAQPPPPSILPPPAQAPIDGGLGLLAAAGAGYAWKRLREGGRR